VQTNNKEKASRQTHTQEATKLTKENSTRTKHKWKRAECDHVKKRQKKKQQNRILQAYENKNILHVSAYMAIFRCVGCFYFQVSASKTSEADSFRNMKVKISYTLEDGHVGRNM
jgi:hypothetical protein